MFDIFTQLLKITSCRVTENTKKKIRFGQTALGVKQKIANSNKSIKYSEDQAINIAFDELFKNMGLEMKEDIDPTHIKVMEGILKQERVDNNFKPGNKRILKSLGEALFDEGMVSKKLGYDEVLSILIKHYIEHFPKLKKYTLEEQYIDQQFRTKEAQKQREKNRYRI